MHTPPTTSAKFRPLGIARPPRPNHPRTALLVFCLITCVVPGVQAQGLSDREQAAASGPNQGKASARTEVAANGGATDAALVQKTFRVGVTLGDGRSLRGKIRMRMPDKLSIIHIVDGIQYRKIIRPEELRAISFKRWRGTLVRQQEGGQIFQFDVDRYSLELTSGQILHREGDLFEFLQRFEVENENGSVQLFSFWGDLQKKDGSWFTGMQGPSTSRVACHKDVVQRIEFEES